MTIGERIESLRVERGWTMAELERRSGVSRDQLSRVTNNHFKPSWTTLVGVSFAFEMTLAEVVGEVKIHSEDLPARHPARTSSDDELLDRIKEASDAGMGLGSVDYAVDAMRRAREEGPPEGDPDEEAPDANEVPR